MQRRYGLVVVGLAVACLVAVSLWRREPTAPSSRPPQTGQPDSIDVEGLERQMGLGFEPVDPAQVRVPVLGREQAIAKAQEAEPITRQATGVAAALGVLGSAPRGVIVDALEPTRLVWLVRFQGVINHASGEPGDDGRVIGLPGVSHTYSVVIDATTGERIVSFTY